MILSWFGFGGIVEYLKSSGEEDNEYISSSHETDVLTLNYTSFRKIIFSELGYDGEIFHPFFRYGYVWNSVKLKHTLVQQETSGDVIESTWSDEGSINSTYIEFGLNFKLYNQKTGSLLFGGSMMMSGLADRETFKSTFMSEDTGSQKRDLEKTDDFGFGINLTWQGKLNIFQ